MVLAQNLSSRLYQRPTRGRLINIHAYNLLMSSWCLLERGLVTKSRWRLKARKSFAKKNTISYHWKKFSQSFKFRCLSNEALEISREELRLVSSLWGISSAVLSFFPDRKKLENNIMDSWCSIELCHWYPDVLILRTSLLYDLIFFPSWHYTRAVP